jgi:hypothetical protein
MSEQVPRNNDLSPEITPNFLGVTRAAIEVEIAKNGIFDLGLIALISSNLYHEVDVQQLGRDVDALLQMFGLDAKDGAGQLVGVASNYSKSKGWKIDQEQVVEARRSGRPLGILLHEYVLAAMPIEDYEDGGGEASLIVKLTDSLALELHGWGDFWTERTYRHPLTGQTLYDSDHAGVIDELIDRADDPELLDSTVSFDMSFNARFTTVEIE